MKACIVTVYNSVNCGSFWQAFIMGEYLKQKGMEVVYYQRDKKGTSVSSKQKIKELLSSFKNGGFKKMNMLLKTYRSFDNLCKRFTIIDSNQLDDVDFFILGSDTIWNLDSQYYTEKRKIYFGDIFPKQKYVLSYAATFANTSLEKVKSIVDVKEMINNLDSISVRDKHSEEIIKSICGRKSQIVCDPTMLFDMEDYKKYVGERIEKEKYILLYLFKKLSDNQLKELEEYANENHLIIVELSIKGHKNVKQVVNEPINFLNYFYYADRIITDTFHGTMFSVNFNKDFYVIDRNKNKVNEFLKNVDLDNRLISMDYHLNKDTKEIIDYKNNKKLKEFKNESREYIDKVISGGK